MKLELAITDANLAPEKVIEMVFEAIKNKVDNIALLSGHITQVRQVVSKNIPTRLSALIDFPLGANSSKTKEFMVLEAIKAGADTVDIVLNNSPLVELPRLAIVKPDILSCVEVADANLVSVRAVLNYRYLDSDTVIDVAKALKKMSVDAIVLGTGTILDDTADVIALAKIIEKKAKIPVVVNVRTLTDSWISQIIECDFYSLQVNSLAAVEKFAQFW